MEKDYLQELSEEKFEETKAGLIAIRLKKDKNLTERINRYFGHINFPRTHCFDRCMSIAMIGIL